MAHPDLSGASRHRPVLSFGALRSRMQEVAGQAGRLGLEIRSGWWVLLTMAVGGWLWFHLFRAVIGLFG